MSVSLNVPAALPCRYYWHTAVPAAARDIRQDDPSVFQFSSSGSPGVTVAAQNKKRPAIGAMCGTAGDLAYIDSRGNTQMIKGMLVGTYYPADIQQLLGSTGANIIPAETGTSAGAVVSTAFKISLFWAL
jgi:hypothetical protein